MQDVAKEYKAAKESGDDAKAKTLTTKLKDMTEKRKELQTIMTYVGLGVGLILLVVASVFGYIELT